MTKRAAAGSPGPGKPGDWRGEPLCLSGTTGLQHGHGAEQGEERRLADLLVERADLLEGLLDPGGGEEAPGPGEPVGEREGDGRDRRAEGRDGALALRIASPLHREVSQGRSGTRIAEGEPGPGEHEACPRVARRGAGSCGPGGLRRLPGGEAGSGLGARHPAPVGGVGQERGGGVGLGRLRGVSARREGLAETRAGGGTESDGQ